MITWIASYPRSGNTLLRTILKKCFDINSYADERPPKHLFNNNLMVQKEFTEYILFADNFENFYKNAVTNSEKIFIKTHNTPIDDQPFIYVIRDGRNSVASYFEFKKDYLNITDPDYIKIILGDDTYTDWTAHFNNWIERNNINGLILKYEDLVNCNDDTLSIISKFINSDIKNSWNNPFNEYHQIEPNFFNKGKIEFIKPDGWTPLINWLFYYKHTELMKRYNYQIEMKTEKDLGLTSDVQNFLKNILNHLDKLIHTSQNFESNLYKKELIINELKKACDERLELINKLSHN